MSNRSWHVFSGARISGVGVVLWMVALAAGLGGGLRPSVCAERFLTVAEGLRLCVPQADRFEERTVSLDGAQAKAVSKHAGLKTPPRAFRHWVARRNDGTVLGVVFWDQVPGKHDLIDYMTAVDCLGKVMQVEVLEYREHYGEEVRQPQWRAQFRGKSAVDPLELSDDIYNISGATISCRRVTQGVKRLLAVFDLVVRPQWADLDDGGRPVTPSAERTSP